MRFSDLPPHAVIENTIAALRNNNIEAFLVSNKDEALHKISEILPEGAEVMNMTSMTLEAIGITKEILEGSQYAAVRKELEKLDSKKDGKKMRILGAVPDWTIGSVHAVTMDGHVLVASLTGSQLPAYAYGAGKVVWVVGAQKIVKDFEEGMQRLYEHTLPLEDARARKAYGVGSAVNKLLVINRELVPGRITMILVNEVLGF